VIYDPKRCDTLLIPTGPSGDHLFTLVTDRCGNGQHLLLNVSTIRDGQFHDNTCELAPGCHPFIKDPSWVVYRSAQIQAAARLGKMVDGWVYKLHDPASIELADQMLGGVATSRFTPKFVKDYLKT